MKIIATGFDGKEYENTYGGFQTYVGSDQYNSMLLGYEYSFKYILGFTQLYHNNGVFFETIMVGLYLIRKYSNHLFEKHIGRLNRYMLIDRSIIIVYNDSTKYKDIIDYLVCPKYKVGSIEELNLLIKKLENVNKRGIKLCSREHIRISD